MVDSLSDVEIYRQKRSVDPLGIRHFVKVVFNAFIHQQSAIKLKLHPKY